MSSSSEPGSGRETRLLLLVIVVAVAVLLVLARFRYPAPDRAAVVPAAGPIERLAARATFEELALIMADLSARVQSDLVVFAIERAAPAPAERRMAVAVRVDVDLALAYLPEGYQVSPSGTITIVADDPLRRLVLLRVPGVPFDGLGSLAPGLGGPGYVAVFEGARGGPSVRPLFIGRVDSFQDVRWVEPVMAVGGHPPLGPGVFVYTLDGRMVGMTIPDETGVSIVRVPSLQAAVEALRTQ